MCVQARFQLSIVFVQENAKYRQTKTAKIFKYNKAARRYIKAFECVTVCLYKQTKIGPFGIWDCGLIYVCMCPPQFKFNLL